MREHIRAVDIANRIRLKRTQLPRHAFVIVEGDDDSRFVTRHLAPTARAEVAHGKPRAIEATLMLERDGFRGALALLDSDHDRLLAETVPCPNLIYTDAHDIECLLLGSPALEHVLRELGNADKIRRFESDTSRSVRQHLLSEGESLGLLRLASRRRNWSLRFEGLDFTRFLDSQSVTNQPDRLLEAVRGHQGGASGSPPSTALMREAMEACQRERHDPWEICCGHDLVEILSMGLRRAWGERNAAEVAPTRLEAMLRLSYEGRYFSTSKIARYMWDWQERNLPFIVMSPEIALPDDRPPN